METAEIGVKSPKVPTITVVVPTIGRASLINAVNSALRQTFPPVEILIVGHEFIKLQGVIEQFADVPSVKVLTNKNGSASANRNQGVDMAIGSHIAFLDDDDIWMPEKLDKQIRALIEGDYDLISCRCLYHGYRNNVVPKKTYIGPQPFLESIYGRWSFMSRSFGIQMPTILVDSKVARKVKFRLDFTEREDLLFVNEIQIRGYKIKQLEDVLVSVHSAKPLSRRKVSIEQDLLWFEYLQARHSSLGWKFLVTVALRNRLASLQVIPSFKLLIRAARGL
jgi:glycosyltransferase involved in cell wall biosynthesis